MCSLTGVTSGPIQPGKEDSQVTGECGDRKSVRYTARAMAPSWQCSLTTRSGEQGVAAFSSSAHFTTWISLSQNNLSIILYLFYLLLLSLLAGKGNYSGFTRCMLFGKRFVFYDI